MSLVDRNGNSLRMFPSTAEPSGSYVFLLLLVQACLLAPLTGFAHAFVAHKLWSWYLFDLAQGPTLRQWFGILLLIDLPLLGLAVALQRVSKQIGETKVRFTGALNSAVLLIALGFMLLLSAWVVRVVAL